MKPFATISLDLDNQWSYMKTHGDSGWESFPSYLDIFIPMIVDILDNLNLKITFFIVGKDAALDKNRDALKLITERGHEIGNHSFNHDVWLHTYPRDKLETEILKAEEKIYLTTGQRTIGFRGPGFVWSPELLEILFKNQYIYDATLLPTYIGPLARMYYFWNSNLSSEQKVQRGKIYSGIKEGLRPVKPFYWELPSGDHLLEIPVTTIPVFKTPFHLSYLIYLSQFSETLMLYYFRMAMILCRITQTAPSFLLHPLDIISGEQIPELKFFPGMNLSSTRKLELFKTVIKMLEKWFKLINMGTYAEFVFKENDIKICSPKIYD